MKPNPNQGYRLIRDELEDAGTKAGQKRVYRLCKMAGISSVIHQRATRYKRSVPPAHDDLVERDSYAGQPSTIWLTDIIEHPTKEGKLYACVVKYMIAGRIVGYAIEDTMTTELPCAALSNAIRNRQHVKGFVVHSDRRSQFQAKQFLQLLQLLQHHGLKGSMGNAGTSADNVAMESWFSLYKRTCSMKRIGNRKELRLIIVEID